MNLNTAVLALCPHARKPDNAGIADRATWRDWPRPLTAIPPFNVIGEVRP